MYFNYVYMKKDFTIKIIDYTNWNLVFWRTTWNKIKNIFNPYYELWVKVNIDFYGIKSVTHSFIDELIWSYIYYDLEKALERISFLNCDDDIKTMIKFVVNDRIKNAKEIS